MAYPRPFGNSFLVDTPALDQLEQRLFAEQKQREAQRQRDITALDDEFSKNVTNIRDADVDDLTKAYQDYKAGTQALMKIKGGVSPQQQMEVLRKKADMYKLINESKAEREREEMMGKRYSTKPDDFNDDAAELLIAGRNLPVSKKRAYTTKDGKIVDLTNPENLLWQDKTNWQPILQKAGGTPTLRGKVVEKELPGGLETEQVAYKAGNDPMEYYTSIVGAMNTPRAAQSLASRYKFSPEEAQDIAIKYDALSKTPEFINAYGEIKFPESANITEGTRTAKLLAMVNALNNPPSPIKKNVKSLAAVTADRQRFQIEQQARAQTNKQANIRLASALGVGAWKDKYTFDKIATEEGVNRNDLTVTDLIKNATGSDGQLNIEPSLLGLPDYAQNLKISADGKQISYDVTYDGGEVKTTTVTSEAPKKFMSNKLDLKVVPVTPSQNVRLPKDIKKTKVEKREFVFPNGKTSF